MLQQGMYDEKELNHIESSLNKDSGGCTSNTAGTAYLFEIDHLKPTHLKFEKLEGQDARRLEPHQCKNHFIDNTNLHDVGSKGNAPIIAFLVYGETTWRSGIALIVTPHIVVIQPIIFDHQRNIKNESYALGTIELKPMDAAFAHWRKTGTIKKLIKICYINRAILASTVDGKIKCSTDGPDTVKLDALPLNSSTLKKINTIMASNEYKFFTNFTEASEVRNEQKKKRPKYDRHHFCHYHKNTNILHVPSQASVVGRKDAKDKFLVAEYLDWPTMVPKGMRMMAYLAYDDVKALLKYGKISRQDWHTELIQRSKGNFLRKVYDVPNDGCITIVEASCKESIGLYEEGTGELLMHVFLLCVLNILQCSATLHPYQRNELPICQWEVRNDYKLNHEAIKFATQYTFGDGSINRSCAKSFGTCWYKGERQSAYVAQNGRSAPEDCIHSQFQRKWVDPTFLPWFHKLMNTLTGKSLTVRLEFDPTLSNLISKVHDCASKERDFVATVRSIPKVKKCVLQANSGNRIQILTATNGKGHFCCGELHLLFFSNKTHLMLFRESL